MATVTRIPVNPGVLRWARDTANLDVATAARRAGLKPERLADYERGDRDPTMKQVRALAAAYHRPLGALFLQQPPSSEAHRRVPDYRRPQTQSETNSRALANALMRAYRQQEAMRDIAEELDEPTDQQEVVPLSFDSRDLAESNGATLRLAMDMESLSESAISRPSDMLRLLIRRAELLNVTVIQVQRVSINEMRGFSLGEGTFPFVALNGADWPRGKIFTLLHELAHVGFHTSGLCDLRQEGTTELERACDAVAASALMPDRAFLAAVGRRPASTELARDVGNGFGASGESALLRMISLGVASWDDYRRLKPDFEAAYEYYKREEKEQSAGKDSPIFYQLKARDLGRRFIQQMISAYNEGAVSSRDLVQLLEVSYDKVPRLAATIGEDF